jgi:hypothetical protein
VSEYGRFPFPKPDTKVRRKILGELAAAHRQLQSEVEKDANADFGAEARMQPYEELFDGLVYQYYNLDSWERWLVADTVNFWIPSATPTRGTAKIPTLQQSVTTDRDFYCRILLEALSDWSVECGRGMRAQPILDTATNLAVLRLTLTDTEAQQVEIERASTTELQAALKRVARLLPVQ